MVVLSLASAADYFYGFWSKIDRQVSKRRKRFVLSRRKKQEIATPQQSQTS
jgi:hypothetical protein